LAKNQQRSVRTAERWFELDQLWRNV